MNRFRNKALLLVSILTAAVFIFLIPVESDAEGESQSCGAHLEWTLDDEGLLTISGTGEMDSFIGKKPGWNYFRVKKVIIEPGVTSIGAQAFKECHFLRSIEIPDSVTAIGDYAFADCSLLKSITLPDSLCDVGANPFCYCSSIKEIILSADHPVLALQDGMLYSKTDCRLICRIQKNETPVCVIPAEIRLIGDYALADCSVLTGVIIPDGVTEIGKGAFSGCDHIENIDIPESVISIGDSAFSMCELLRSVTLREGLQSIGSRAFFCCRQLETIAFPDSLSILGSDPFDICQSLTEIRVSPEHALLAYDNGMLFSKPDRKLIYYAAGNPAETCAVPEGTRIIGENAFGNGENIRTIILPESVTQIENRGFSGCWQAEEVVFSQGLESIGAEAFYNLAALEEIVLPEGLKAIGDSAFSGCKGLKRITIPASVTDIGRGILTNTDTIHLAVCVTEGSAAEKYCEEHHLKAVAPGEEIPDPEANMSAAFVRQFPGYKGLYQIGTQADNEEVYLAQTPEGMLVLLCGTKREESGWTIIESSPLPAESTLIEDGGEELLDLGYAHCTVRRYHDDVWGINFTGWRDLYVGPKWIGFYGPPTRYYGIHSWGDLTTIDWITVEDSLKDAMKSLDVSTYATPDRENPEDRTPIYSGPDEGSEEIALLMNGAPLFVTGQKGEWTHVCLGRDDGKLWKLDGWIRTEFLAFGTNVNIEHFAGPGWELFAKKEQTITIMTPTGSETVSGADYEEGEHVVIGEETIDGLDYWLVYECYTEQVGFILKEDLHEPVG